MNYHHPDSINSGSTELSFKRKSSHSEGETKHMIIENILNARLKRIIMHKPLSTQPTSADLIISSSQLSHSSLLCEYDIQQTIGSGNFGKVKLGIYKPTNKKVAIKILSKEKIAKKNEMKIVKRELDILPSFNHVNVIHFSKCVEDSSNIYIIMDYCELGELFDYIVSKTRLNEDETAFFFYQIINGVDYIHSKGVAHRDLKPENLLLTKNKLLKIVDFGLASTSNNQCALRTRCGSPSYASPELLRGRKYNGYKTDVWSSGVILYAMSCGYLPFDGKTNDELFKLIIRGNVEYPSFLSETVKRVLKKMLVVNPDQRITIREIRMDSLYLRGKKLFEDQFGFDSRAGLNTCIKANFNVSGSVDQSNSQGIANVNTFRKKITIVEDNKNCSSLIAKGKEGHKQPTPMVMAYLQTEPDATCADEDSAKAEKMTPLNFLCANSNTKDRKRDIAIKTDFFLLHKKVDTTTKNYSIGRKIKDDIRNSIFHSKNKGSNDIHFSIDHNRTTNSNPIKVVNRLLEGKAVDLKDRTALMSRFPFQNYINNGAVKAQSKRKRISGKGYNSISYEENHKKRVVLYQEEVLPQLSHY